MIGDISIQEKSFGNKSLVKNIKFSINDNEKIGIVGRNGVGKSTLFKILSGQDDDFQGEINYRKGLRIVSTEQEHFLANQQNVVEYILSGIPDYSNLKQKIDYLAENMGDDLKKIEQYTEALDQFSQKGFYLIEEKIVEQLKEFGLAGFENRAVSTLSGGQKRMLEIIKIMHSDAHLALLDEPTNHMDYVAKNQFIDWMNSQAAKNTAILVVTHDRDVLENVDRIIELKDGFCQNYVGNYDEYLKQNASVTSVGMSDFEQIKKRIANLRQKVIDYQRLKEKSRNPSTIQKFKRLENGAREELAELEEIEKPTFWVDKTSVNQLDYKSVSRYGKYKTKNIRMNVKSDDDKNRKIIISARDLSLGYGDKILFDNIDFDLRLGEILEVRGPNGAGKSTLINYILSKMLKNFPAAKDLIVWSGEVSVDSQTRIGVYSQEMSAKYLKMSLREAIEDIYLSKNQSIGETKIRQLASDYLFTGSDLDCPVEKLSGGQKARLQIISMLANDPKLLVLDEPTNHLDLPSIEELETALQKFSGAILYVSHDNYFRKVLQGEILKIDSEN